LQEDKRRELNPDLTLEELKIKQQETRPAPVTMASVAAGTARATKLMTTPNLDLSANPVVDGSLVKLLQDIYQRMGQVAADGKAVDKLFWAATRLKNMVIMT